MSIRSDRWAAGCAALLIGAATPALSQPPQVEPDRRSQAEPGADVDQIRDRAEQRAKALDEKLDENVESRDQSTGAADSASPDRRTERLPAGFDRLALSEEEQAAMFRVIGQYDRQIQQVLGRFEDLHAEAIGIEAIPLAAMMREKGDTKLVDSPNGPQQRTAGFRPGDVTKPAGSPAPNESDPAGEDSAEKIKELGEKSPLAGPAAEKWQQLHALHLDAVRLEAQKLVAIEKLLPAEKLEQLHKLRAEASGGRADRPERPDLQNENQNPEEERRDREADRAAGAGGAEARSGDKNADPTRPGEPKPQ